MRLTNLTIAALLCLILGCDRRSGGANHSDPATREPQEVATVAFYNVENLFDSSDDPDNPGDNEYLPSAAKRWDDTRYAAKRDAVARVIADLGGEEQAGGPALVGLAEVENEAVVRALAASDNLRDSDYGVVHFESPDFRGIDVALLYRRRWFSPLLSRRLSVQLPLREGSTTRRTTRDILYVKGLLRGDTLHYLVNHWPSRGGGEVVSRPGRLAAAAVARIHVDSLLAAVPTADVIVAGDLNDDPDDDSVVEGLRAVPRRDLAVDGALFNPFHALFVQGLGTLGYRKAWNLFDQTVVSEGLATYSGDWSLRYGRIFAPGYLLQASGSYQGFPDRTYVGDDYRGGTSDHLPVVLVLTRPK